MKTAFRSIEKIPLTNNKFVCYYIGKLNNVTAINLYVIILIK